MTIDATPAAPEDTRPLRDLYRHELACQIVHDSWHARGWVDSYLLRRDGRVVGYGLVGGIRAKRKEIVTEFYVLPDHRGAALALFHRFVAVSRAKRIEVQTNDVLLTLMLYDSARRIKSDTILFHDVLTTSLAVPGATFRKVAPDDGVTDDSEWLVEAGGKVAATGGVLFHYNVPYGDIYMATAEPSRRRGYGSYLVQELKRICYEKGRIPAARCNAANAASRATLQKAGLLPCARILTGTIAS